MRILLLAVMAIVVALAFIPGDGGDNPADPAESAAIFIAEAGKFDWVDSCEAITTARAVVCWVNVHNADLRARAAVLVDHARSSGLRPRGWVLMVTNPNRITVEQRF